MPRLFIHALLLIAALSTFALGQEQKPAQTQPDDVVRIETSLMQAGVTVLDKQGKFVDNLKAEQFEVRVDDKPQTISFFERVAAGSSEERAKIEAARGAKSTSPASVEKYGGALPDEGRVILFFLDDLHMTPDSTARARKVIQHFVDKEMGENDVAAVASASGQLGFLQQITGNRNVLRAAI
jgi:VWFA-related protein